MPTTSNFGWTTPADTDLVKDGAAAIRTLGNGIDTSLVDLKGGTTGQVLSKASNTDLDFTWTADATGIPATIFDAKGDIIAASAADTAARLAVGTNGQVLTADSTTATGLKWGSASANLTLTDIASGSMPSATSLNLTGLTQDYFMLRLSSLQWSGGDTDMTLQFNSNSSSVYGFVVWSVDDVALYRDFNAATDKFYMQVADVGGTGNNTWYIEVKNAKAAGYKTVTIVGVNPYSSYNAGSIMQGYFKNSTQITSMQISTSNSRTFTGGTYDLIGG